MVLREPVQPAGTVDFQGFGLLVVVVSCFNYTPGRLVNLISSQMRKESGWKTWLEAWVKKEPPPVEEPSDKITSSPAEHPSSSIQGRPCHKYKLVEQLPRGAEFCPRLWKWKSTDVTYAASNLQQTSGQSLGVLAE